MGQNVATVRSRLRQFEEELRSRNGGGRTNASMTANCIKNERALRRSDDVSRRHSANSDGTLASNRGVPERE